MNDPKSNNNAPRRQDPFFILDAEPAEDRSEPIAEGTDAPAPAAAAAPASPASPASPAPLPPLSQEELHIARRRFAIPALGLASIFAFSLIAQIVAILILYAVAPELEKESWYSVLVSTLPMYLVAMPLSLLIFHRSKGAAPIEPKKINLGAFLGLVALCFAMTVLGNIVGTAVNAVIGFLTGKPPVNDLQEMTTTTPLWANLLTVGILAPILEEIFFRKLVIDRLRPFGDLPAILISGIMFGALHGNFYQFFYAAGMGVIFGYIYLYTGKLRYTVGLHMTINLIGGVYASEILKRLNFELLETDALAFLTQDPAALLMYLAYSAFIGACFVGAPIALIFFWKHIKFKKAERPLTAREWCTVILKNPAAWIFLCMVAVMFLM